MQFTEHVLVHQNLRRGKKEEEERKRKGRSEEEERKRKGRGKEKKAMKIKCCYNTLNSPYLPYNMIVLKLIKFRS
ncbi:hypothetical protein BpHYR1_009557 [Brachionus plicatilis]|uniref:Uncharacterized protein n=1 Tax=Brachionus plicatilis TaxID=10195 RepID=A0A3M7REL1_BRAPC|nr:hypothetical protein BpHYR1_009557 [Brachionus plicatilis]